MHNTPLHHKYSHLHTPNQKMFVPYLYTEHACAYSILCKITGICRRLIGMFDGLMKEGWFWAIKNEQRLRMLFVFSVVGMGVLDFNELPF
jgi:hypothetical protein